MQIRELEKVLGVELVERRPGEVVLTDIGIEVMRRGGRVLSETRDLVDFARHHGRPLTGRLRLGVIPTIAPYLLPSHSTHPAAALARNCGWSCAKARPRFCSTSSPAVRSTCVMLALPVAEGELEAMPCSTIRSCWRSRPAIRTRERARQRSTTSIRERLILLEEGHCLRDQALAYCGNGAAAAAPWGSGRRALRP